MRQTKWIILGAALACGGKDGPGSASSSETSSGSSTLATTAETGSSSGATTGSSSSGATTGVTTGVTTGSTSAGTSEGTTGGGGSFARFRLSEAAGPCPPDHDCDGFTELLASGLLRVEVFGDVSDTVMEVQVSPEDLAASIPAFTDPALLALLDQPEPLCEPPTDIFEGMLAEVEGVVHEATTTACDQPPLAAARTAALALRTKYVP